MDYQPKLLHASITTIMAVALLALSEIASGNAFTALIVGAVAFLWMTAVIVWMIAYSNHYDTVVRYIDSFIKLDTEQRSALAFHLPHLRLRASRGVVGQYFEDTRATVEHVRLFILDSDSIHTCSQRDWNTREKPRWAWEEIYEWLVQHGKVVKDSASGSHSYQWIGSAHQGMMFYYLDHSTPDLNAAESYDSPVVYAADNHLPTLDASPSGGFQEQKHSRGGQNGQNRGSGG